MVKAIFKMPINREVVLPRLDDVSTCLLKLKRIQKIAREDFFGVDSDYPDLVSYNLQRALEGLLSCGSHILSRIEGAKFTEYATIAEQLVRYEILPASLKEVSIKMAKYRNRLVHFYHEVENEELYQTLHNDISDLETFYHVLLKFISNNFKS